MRVIFFLTFFTAIKTQFIYSVKQDDFSVTFLVIPYIINAENILKIDISNLQVIFTCYKVFTFLCHRETCRVRHSDKLNSRVWKINVLLQLIILHCFIDLIFSDNLDVLKISPSKFMLLDLSKHLRSKKFFQKTRHFYLIY